MTVRICVINGKGGCGKTTTSTHLAAAFAVSGLNTLLVDLDRHKGASRWHKMRPKSAPPIRLAQGKAELADVRKDVQRMVIDCPASLRTPQIREIVAESDLLIVPLLPSIFDEHATKLFLKRVMTIKKVRKGWKDILVVHNRYRTRSRASQELDAYLEKLGHPPHAHISDRSVYPQLAGQGLSVFDAQTKSLQALQEEWMPLIEQIEPVS